MEDINEAEMIRRAFKLVCRKCGSEDVAIDFEHGINYGGQTGYQEGQISFGCNACRENDVYINV